MPLKFLPPIALLLRSSLHKCITPRLRVLQLHFLSKDLKPLDLLNRFRRTLHRIEHHKRLPLGFQIRLSHDLEDGAIFGEEFRESGGELIRLDALFEVADVDSVRRVGLVQMVREEGTRRVGVQ